MTEGASDQGARLLVWPAALTSSYNRQTTNTPTLRLTATVGQEPEVELGLV